MFGVKMTNENKAMLKFDEVVLDWATLSKIPKAQLAFLSMLMMASNEINSLLRAYSVQDHDTEERQPKVLVLEASYSLRECSRRNSSKSLH